MDTVTHLSTNLTQHRLTLFIEANALTTTSDHQPSVPKCVCRWGSVPDYIGEAIILTPSSVMPGRESITLLVPWLSVQTYL